MSINITDGFNINFAAPVDYRMLTANSTTRLAIAYKYDGLKVFQLDNRVSYIWNSGGSGNWDIENSDKISGSGFTNYIPKFTSTSQIGASSIYVNGDKVGINTNDPKEYMQIGSFPVAYAGQSLPLTIHKGGSAIIGYNWYYDGGDQSFNSSVGSSTIGFGGGEIQFQQKEVSSSFKTSLYLKSNGNILIGTNTPTQISGSSSLFTNAFPKLDILTGDSSGAYQELMTLRHNMDSSVALRRLGYIMKMSDESTLVESSKMGGMILESSSGYADYPSLYLTTGDQKRLGVTHWGDISLRSDTYSSMDKSAFIGSASYSVSTSGSTLALLKSITVPSSCDIIVECTFIGRADPGSNPAYYSNKIMSLYNVDGSGAITQTVNSGSATASIFGGGHSYTSMSGTTEVYPGNISTTTNTLTFNMGSTCPFSYNFETKVYYQITIV
jgi:hypothetical protein